MLALLIVIFPLVAFAYGYERTTKPDSTILRNWLEEFLVNVFVQMVHAILYVTLVEGSYSVYIATNGNWLLYVISVLGLLTAEGVTKHVLGLRGNTVGSLTQYATKGLAYIGAGTAIAGNFLGMKKDMQNIENSYQNREASIAKKQAERDKRRNTIGSVRDNITRKSKHLTEEQKRRKLATRQARRQKRNAALLKLRKVGAKARKFKKIAGKITRPLVNAAATVGAVAGGIAAGGDASDFVAAAGVARAITGGVDKPKELSDDAKKAAAENNVKTQTELGNVSTENKGGSADGGANPLPGPNGGGYNGGTGGSGNNTTPAPKQPTPEQMAKKEAIARQLSFYQTSHRSFNFEDDVNIHPENK